MKINVLLNLGTNEYRGNPLTAGEHEVEEKFGRLLISRGHAVEIPEPEVTVKAEAKQGEVVAAKSPVDVTAAKPDNFQKMRAENQPKAEVKAVAETKKPTSNKEA